ncbi:MAG: hypothetical protein K0R76_214 [Alphaproteobacteria bacterium]|jgi:hypothetical protein|nr:hypothetical protein [Alphaproteobacteria bacterium]MDF3033260.1 hypothetical protein [Alphaproteobacteria bacterium]
MVHIYARLYFSQNILRMKLLIAEIVNYGKVQ